MDIDVGIDPESIDYSGNVGSSLTNDQIAQQFGGGDWTPSNYYGPGAYDGSYGSDSGGGALASTEAPSQSIHEEMAQGPSGIKTAGGGQGGLMATIGKALGLTNKSGSFDLSDPKTLEKIIKLGLGVGGVAQSMSATRAANQAATQAQLQQQLMQQRNNTWTPQQAQWANQFFNTPVNPNRGVAQAGANGLPIVPSRGYAEGGEIQGFQLEPTEGVMPGFQEEPMQRPVDNGGAFGLIDGAGTGQSDDVDIKAARGEYLFDAETVSMIGDGSNEAGAEILDKWREYLREHKRSAANDKIAPSAKDPSAYLPKGAQ